MAIKKARTEEIGTRWCACSQQVYMDLLDGGDGDASDG